MPFIGNKPSAVPLTSADITDGIITSAKIADGTIVNADINASAAIDGTKISGSFGKVLQVVSATDNTSRSTNSTSFITASNTLSVAITPSSASNKVLIIVGSAGNGGDAGYYTIFKGATNLGSNTGMSVNGNVAGGTTGGVGMNYLDSPATTSSTTYQVYIRSNTSGANVTLNADGVKGSITCLEIAG